MNAPSGNGKADDDSAGYLTVDPSNSQDRAARTEAFRCHVEPEIEVLLRVARTLVGPAEAEDLVQETLVRAWRFIDRFDGRHPRAWLLTILRNTNMNMHRRQRPTSVEDIGSYTGARPAFGAEPSNTEEQVMQAFLPHELERAVRSLDPKFRTVLLLIDVDELTYSEAADALGVPVGTVMSRLSRARDRLRRQLRPQFAAAEAGARR